MIASDLFDFPASLPFAAFFPGDAPPWEWVRRIKEALGGDTWAPSLPEGLPPGLHVTGAVYIHPTAKLPPFGVIEGRHGSDPAASCAPASTSAVT
jgi:hypothetical protein